MWKLLSCLKLCRLWLRKFFRIMIFTVKYENLQFSWIYLVFGFIYLGIYPKRKYLPAEYLLFPHHCLYISYTSYNFFLYQQPYLFSECDRYISRSRTYFFSENFLIYKLHFIMKTKIFLKLFFKYGYKTFFKTLLE